MRNTQEILNYWVQQILNPKYAYLGLPAIRAFNELIDNAIVASGNEALLEKFLVCPVTPLEKPKETKFRVPRHVLFSPKNYQSEELDLDDAKVPEFG